MRQRGHEDFARDAFQRFALSRGGLDFHSARGAEPPDFDLVIDGVAFALEVTQIMESVQVGGRAMTERGAIAAMRAFVDQVEAQARASGVLRGFYAVHVTPIADFAKLRPDLVSSMMDYLAATSGLASAPPHELWRGRGGRRWYISKSSSQGAALAASFSVGAARWQGEAIDKLVGLVGTAISEKTAKTHHLSRPIILALVDRYHYCEAEDWRVSFKRVPAGPFHTVVRVFLDHQCQVLASRSASWQPAA